MPIVPQPDRDSRYPDRYCTTCGRGFKSYLECGYGGFENVLKSSSCNMDGIVPENPPNPDWNKPLPGQGAGSSSACPNAPMNATLTETVANPDWQHGHTPNAWPLETTSIKPYGGIAETAPILPQVWETVKSAKAEPKFPQSEWPHDKAFEAPIGLPLQHGIDAGWTTDTKALAKATENIVKPSTGSDDGWTTAPIETKS